MLSKAIDLMAYGVSNGFSCFTCSKKREKKKSFTCKRDLKIIDEGVIGSKHEREVLSESINLLLLFNY